MKKLFKKQLEIEIFKIKELEMLMLNSVLLKMVISKEVNNVKNMNYNINRTQLKEINKLALSRKFRIS
jgi:hypothetical protein